MRSDDERCAVAVAQHVSEREESYCERTILLDDTILDFSVGRSAHAQVNWIREEMNELLLNNI